MTSGNGTEQSGKEPEFSPVDRSLKDRAMDSNDGEDTAVDRTPAASADRPRTSRRKDGVEYRPV